MAGLSLPLPPPQPGNHPLARRVCDLFPRRGPATGPPRNATLRSTQSPRLGSCAWVSARRPPPSLTKTSTNAFWSMSAAACPVSARLSGTSRRRTPDVGPSFYHTTGWWPYGCRWQKCRWPGCTRRITLVTDPVLGSEAKIPMPILAGTSTLTARLHSQHSSCWEKEFGESAKSPHCSVRAATPPASPRRLKNAHSGRPSCKQIPARVLGSYRSALQRSATDQGSPHYPRAVAKEPPRTGTLAPDGSPHLCGGARH